MILIAKEHVKGKKRIFPKLGTVEIPADGRFEIEDEELARGIAEGGEFHIEGEETTKANEALSAAEEAILGSEVSTTKEIEDELSKLDLAGLQQLAKEGGDKFKGWHLFKTKEEVLRKFILNKLTVKQPQK